MCAAFTKSRHYMISMWIFFTQAEPANLVTNHTLIATTQPAFSFNDLLMNVCMRIQSTKSILKQSDHNGLIVLVYWPILQAYNTTNMQTHDINHAKFKTKYASGQISLHLDDDDENQIPWVKDWHRSFGTFCTDISWVLYLVLHVENGPMGTKCLYDGHVAVPCRAVERSFTKLKHTRAASRLTRPATLVSKPFIFSLLFFCFLQCSRNLWKSCSYLPQNR